MLDLLASLATIQVVGYLRNIIETHFMKSMKFGTKRFHMTSGSKIVNFQIGKSEMALDHFETLPHRHVWGQDVFGNDHEACGLVLCRCEPISAA